MLETLVGMELGEIQGLLSKLEGASVPAFRARQVYDAIYRQRVGGPEQITTLSKSLRAKLATELAFGLPRVRSVYTSSDGTRRYLLELADGKTIESVLMPEGERHTFCISSQVGCPVNCRFCLTAQLGLERNLTAGEIVGQVLLLAAFHGLSASIQKLNVVMMGQGEPLLNLDQVMKAVRLLADPQGVGLSERRLTLSTSGIVPKIDELGQHRVRPKLAISLNASTEEQRRALMPITRKYTLRDLLEACRRYPLRPWEHLTFEYVLLRGVNDSDADARRVVKLLGKLRCKVNLIALNPGPGIPFETPEPERVASFQSIVKRSLPCFVRKPRGRDIFAACGQLKRMAESEALIGIRPRSELEVGAPFASRPVERQTEPVANR
ncbi:MAG: 23S rRNA (adenine(2503)-C(2))-methyltransferase RlmN [Bryobacteraceae bacterium]|nr:23S rRNA (adenine(2503)-C(2))-methyltransferase RlmN [Bryobacteraceae bacterium]MDW8379751.1 23S rRNA (adenine(2503)-C(2))-methyltransferase RlmN [Bryobacterales bacterium]